MKLKKLLQGSVFAAALGLCLATGVVSAEAATVTTNKTLTSVGAGDSVSFDAVKVKRNVAEYNLKAKWDLYEKANSTADLSKLNTTKKDVYFAVKSSTGTDIYKALKDTQKKYKATCDGSKITITVDGNEVSDVTAYSWRTDNSAGWTAFTAASIADVTPYTMQGATLYIRYNGKSSISPAANATPEKITVGDDEVTVKEIAADSFVGKEFKVKIPKKANAPAINVDYKKGIIKKNAKAVYKTAATMSAALTATWGDKMSGDYTIANNAAGIFMMQIPADEAKKKPASKISFFEWPVGTAPTVGTYTAPTLESKKGDFIANKLSYEAKDNKKVSKATFEITSKDEENAYEILDADGKVIATVTSKKPAKLTATKAPAGKDYTIRIAGDKKKGTLPSQPSTTKFQPVYLETPAAE